MSRRPQQNQQHEADYYNRLDPFHDNAHSQELESPVMDHRRDPRAASPAHPLAGAGLGSHLQEDPYGRMTSNRQNPEHPAMPHYPSDDRLANQPSYSVDNLGHSYRTEGADRRESYHTTGQYSYNNTGGHYSPDEYDDPHRYNQGGEEAYPLTQYPTNQNDPHTVGGGFGYDDQDPMLQHQGVQFEDDGQQYGGDAEPYGYGAPTPQPQIKRWKTVKKVELYRGNLVLDCPVPKRLVDSLPVKNSREFTHMRYSAATCDPSQFVKERFTLRQRLFAKPRHTELFIVVTMYNEDEILFARTMHGVMKNVAHLCSRTRSQTWGEEAWKKVVVCVVSDGRGKINKRTQSLLAGMGVYQEGIAKNAVNDKPVTAHIYEYTTQVSLELKDDLVRLVPGQKGSCPVQILFCLKEKNQKKINSHRWFFQAFGEVLQPNVCVLLDAGTKPGGTSIYHLWKAFEVNPYCAGACGEIKAMLGTAGKNLLNPLVATQNFEYKMSNILDKPLESVFGFISVLPGAFSAYRYVALQNDARGEGPLEKYFKGETMHGANAGVFEANMYLAEDRILCFELVAKRRAKWVLQYVKSSYAETDVPDQMPELILQRRRWLNGSFFAAVYALAHAFSIWRSDHSFLRKIMFHIEFFYQTISMIFAFFAIGNFFLVFRILAKSMADPALKFPPGNILGIVFEWLYLACLLTCFILSLGNRPQGSPWFYMGMVVFWAIIMVYLMFCAIWISVHAIQAELAANANRLSFSSIIKNKLFVNLIVSLGSTYVLYFVSSFLFFEPWHMFTSFVQYLLLSPTYVNVLNVYAFCNTHDISWGTKGDDKMATDLGVVKVGEGGKVDVNIPSDDKDLDAQYESELKVLNTKVKEVKKAKSPEEVQEDYYRGFRSGIVLFWIAVNFILCATILNAAGLERVVVTSEDTRSSIYLAVVLWSVAGLSAFRFLGSCWFLIIRIFRGV